MRSLNQQLTHIRTQLMDIQEELKTQHRPEHHLYRYVPLVTYVPPGGNSSLRVAWQYIEEHVRNHLGEEAVKQLWPLALAHLLLAHLFGDPDSPIWWNEEPDQEHTYTRLANINFSGVHISGKEPAPEALGVSMIRSNLMYSRWQNLRMYAFDFIEAMAMSSVWHKCTLDRCAMHKSHLDKTRWSHTIFTSSEFDCAQVYMGRFENCLFHSCSFKGADLHSAIFTQCTFVECTMVGACVENTAFSECRIILCDWRLAHTQEADFDSSQIDVRTNESPGEGQWHSLESKHWNFFFPAAGKIQVHVPRDAPHVLTSALRTLTRGAENQLQYAQAQGLAAALGIEAVTASVSDDDMRREYGQGAAGTVIIEIDTSEAMQPEDEDFEWFEQLEVFDD